MKHYNIKSSNLFVKYPGTPWWEDWFETKL